LKLIGFGLSVIQRLCKTSVKKNLYWEIKDKVFEESFNGIRSVKKTQRVRVYGLDSTREIRARLIEILYDRVAYHKDKFIAPILHHEMQSMEVKKSGKVEHSQNSHDDQVFSYLMALYVWYDGKNLAENFHIIKNTLKTDQDQDIDELDIEDAIEATEKVDIESSVYDPNSEIVKELEWMEKDLTAITSKQFRDQNYMKNIQQRNYILATNKHARQAYCRDTGIDESMYMDPYVSVSVKLPDSIFMNTQDEYDEDVDRVNSVLVGNMAEWWDKV
jgi:hypothetical protein